MPARVALAAALRVRPRREKEISGERARRGAVALRRVAVQRDPVPERLRIHSPAEMRHRVGIAVLLALTPVLQPVAHQLGVDAAVDAGDVALADLEFHWIAHVPA